MAEQPRQSESFWCCPYILEFYCAIIFLIFGFLCALYLLGLASTTLSSLINFLQLFETQHSVFQCCLVVWLAPGHLPVNVQIALQYWVHGITLLCGEREIALTCQSTHMYPAFLILTSVSKSFGN